MQYINRNLERVIENYLKIFPVVSVTGPRQSGKSTLLKYKFSSKYKYITFDDPVQIELFESDPKGFMKNHQNYTIFDEVQRVPDLFHYLKIEVDNNRSTYGKYILTGSNQFQINNRITETLAGRIGLLSLLPFQFNEIPKKQRELAIINGCYPEVVVRNYQYVREYYAEYIKNYIERDVRSIANIINLRDFQRFVFLLASLTAQELNMNKIANEIGITVKTVQHWISILEASYIIFLLPPYYNNLGKRIVKRPKLYFYDTGLVCYLTGIRDSDSLRFGPLAGPIFENFIIADIKKNIFHYNSDLYLYYFRSNLGLELDLIIENLSEKNAGLYRKLRQD
ncbi:ATP-binding protein [Candidatus Margulisiibacteriota bacterium]